MSDGSGADGGAAWEKAVPNAKSSGAAKASRNVTEQVIRTE